MNIYITNLGERITDESLDATFSTYGTVSSSRILRDQDTDQLKTMAIVEMPNEQEAMRAIQRLNGSIIDGRAIEVRDSAIRADAGNAR